jgi:hypothetical protein
MALKGNFGLYLSLAYIAGSFAGPLQAQDDEINWLGNYREALQQARQSRKPIFVEFRCEA